MIDPKLKCYMDPNGNLLAHPTIALTNKKGEVLFSLKRKMPDGPDGDNIFYLVEIRRDRWGPSDVTELEQFIAEWLAEARALEVPVYDSHECIRAVNHYLEEHKKELKRKGKGPHDIEIQATDLTTDVVHDLTWTVHL